MAVCAFHDADAAVRRAARGAETTRRQAESDAFFRDFTVPRQEAEQAVLAAARRTDDGAITAMQEASWRLRRADEAMAKERARLVEARKLARAERRQKRRPGPGGAEST